MSMIPDEIVDQVRDGADLVGIIGETVQLKRTGADYRGPCPFHGGTHRNFAVSSKKNLYYFLPYYRNVNDSHCTTVLSFAGSDIEDHNMTLAQWVNDFVNDRPVTSMREAPVSGEDGTP